MQSELWRVPLSPNTLSLSSRDVCAALQGGGQDARLCDVRAGGGEWGLGTRDAAVYYRSNALLLYVSTVAHRNARPLGVLAFVGFGSQSIWERGPTNFGLQGFAMALMGGQRLLARPVP